MKTNAVGIEGFIKRNLWYIIVRSATVLIAIGAMTKTLNDHSKTLDDQGLRVITLFKTTAELHTADVRVETKLDNMRSDLTEIKSDMKEVRKFLMDKKIAEVKDDNNGFFIASKIR